MKHSLAVTGLSLSQAQSITNLCYQRALDITNQLSGINNATRTVKVDGVDYEETVGKKMPTNAKDLLLEKAKLHATQAFLMSNIKAKDIILNNLTKLSYTPSTERPIRGEFTHTTVLQQVGEDWGWNELSIAETCEFLEQEAFAAHIGQFIHKDSVLDKLRKQLPLIKSLEWIEIKTGERTPLVIKTHHTSEELLRLHESLATLHRQYEMRVNYFKAKVKNLVTEENARIANVNAVEQDRVNTINESVQESFQGLMKQWTDNNSKEIQEFEAKRQGEIKAAAALRIYVDNRFQSVVDAYLTQLEEPKA